MTGSVLGADIYSTVDFPVHHFCLDDLDLALLDVFPEVDTVSSELPD